MILAVKGTPKKEYLAHLGKYIMCYCTSMSYISNLHCWVPDELMDGGA